MADFTPEALAAIDKVKKLLALANNNPNEHEAAVASAKAMEILEAFNLDMATLSGTREGAGQRQDRKLKGGLYGWQRGLWKACAELHFCMYWSIKGLQKGSAYEHRILGRKENVVGAQVMAEYLQQTVERLAQNWSKEEGFKSVFVKEAIAYREGMARRLTNRLYQLRREKLDAERRAQAEHPNTGGTALILASVVQNEQDLNTDHLNGLEPGTTARRRAEQAAAYAVLRAAWDAEAAEEARILSDPTDPRHAALVARRTAQEAEEARIRREAERREARNAARRKGDGFTYRRLTPQEQRQQMPAFHEGYAKAESVGLDRQVDRTKRTLI